jgi:hypothetical protein
MKVTTHLHPRAKVKNAWGFASINTCRRRRRDMVHKQRDKFIPTRDKRGYTSLAVQWTHSCLCTDATRMTAFNLMNSVVWKRVWAKCWKSKRQQTVYSKQAFLMTLRLRSVILTSTKISYSFLYSIHITSFSSFVLKYESTYTTQCSVCFNFHHSYNWLLA